MCGEKISIITISYNSEKTIERTMQSVLSQSYRPLEYVLVDGASKDGTIALTESYLPKFESAGIAVNFHSEPDQGISDAFNKGVERATGEIIGIINSDDVLSDDILSRIAEAFDSECDVLCGDCLWVDVENGLKYVRRSKLDQLEKIKYEMVLMHPTCFVRKSSYEKYGVFDVKLRYVMDKDLMARFYRMGAKFKYLPEVVTEMYSGGASDANAGKVAEEGIEVAVRNGEPRLKARIRSQYKMVRLRIINCLKRSMISKILFR